MKNKKISIQLGIGIPSIFMLFIIIVMCILAVLTYLNATSYYDSTHKQMIRIQEYYVCQSKGKEIFYKMDNENYLDILKEEEVEYFIDGNILSYKCNMNDNHYLLFEIDTSDLSLKDIKQVSKGD
jgi:hypothetical protein